MKNLGDNVEFPRLVVEEYSYFEKYGRCINTENFEKTFLGDKFKLISDYPPCFFAGRVDEGRDFALISLNPGYKLSQNLLERQIYEEKGWKETYLNFFDWFSEMKMVSPYYSKFATFLGALVGKRPKTREERYNLLGQHIVNFDLIPYHSTGIGFTVDGRNEQQISLLKQYAKTLAELLKLSKAKVVFLNGAPFKQVIESELTPMKIYETFAINNFVNAHFGEILGCKGIWFDKFFSGKSARITNQESVAAANKIASLIS